MSIHCDVQLENARDIYQAGELIRGQIVLTLPERELIRALGWEVSGYAVTAWTKFKKQKKPKKQSGQQVLKANVDIKPSITFENRIDYLCMLNYFIGSETALPKIIESGIYHYNFSVRLPEQCPSSYEGDHGRIRYTLQVFKDTHEQHTIVHSRILKVEHLYDLHDEAVLLDKSVDHMQQEYVSPIKFWQRPLQLFLNIPQQGYTPGERISVYVKIYNPQRLMLTELSYKLNLITTHVGSYKLKRRETKLERHNILTCSHLIKNLTTEEHAGMVQHLQTLIVPATPPTLTATKCECLQLEYELEVIVQTKNRKRVLQAQLPIIIGSNSLKQHANVLRSKTLLGLDLPNTSASLANSMEDLLTASSAPALTTMSVDDNLNASLSSLITNYREADFMAAISLNKSSKHMISGEQIDYRPRYLYYGMHDGDDSTKVQ